MDALEKIKASDKVYIYPAEAAAVLDIDPQWIRETARRNPEKLGFRVLVSGNRCKIMRSSFLDFILGGVT